MGLARSRATGANHPCWMHQLAAVEVQLICHFLDGNCKLLLARCDKRMQQDVSKAFAWAGGGLLSVRADVALEQMLVKPFLRNAPLNLRVSSEVPLSSLSFLQPVHTLEVRSVDALYWTSLLQSSLTRDLHTLVLHLGSYESANAIQVISKYLPQLKSLTLIRQPVTAADQEVCQNGYFIAPLSHCSQLTHLELSMYIHWTFEEHPRKAAWHLPALRTLKLSRRHFATHDLASIFFTCQFRMIQHLELNEFTLDMLADQPRIIADSEYEHVFACLRELRSVCFRRMRLRVIERWFAHTHTATDLQLVRLISSDVPSFTTLRLLLDRCAPLHMIELHVSAWVAFFSKEYFERESQGRVRIYKV
jgi:hypothetical protein